MTTITISSSGWERMVKQNLLAQKSLTDDSKLSGKIKKHGRTQLQEPNQWAEEIMKMAREPAPNPLNVQEGGGHYKSYPIQPVEFAMKNKLDLCQANVIKYVVRFRHKGGIEDLRKARHYIELLAQFEYGESVS